MSEQLGRYEIIGEIGRGGMSTVYTGRDPRIEREVAIKVLSPYLAADPAFVARFQREVRTLAALEHGAILPIYDFFESGGQLCLVMRLMRGGTLADRLLNGPMILQEAIAVLRPVADALDYAHARGIVHRDIKPSNVAFDEHGNPFLMDFGLARMADSVQQITATGAFVGTPAYMAPEQIYGQGLTPAVDIYSLGVVAFELLSGRPPFSGDNPMAVAFQSVNEPPPSLRALRPGLPVDIDAVIGRALSKTPDERYAKATAFVEALQAVAGGVAAPAPPPTAAPETTDRRQATQVPPAPTLYGPPASVISGETIKPPLLHRLWRGALALFGQAVAPAGTGQPPAPALSAFRVPTTPATPPAPPPAESNPPSLVLQPHLRALLAPVHQYTIRELLKHQEPEHIVNYLAAYGGGRFLITGYGSYGGSSLTRAICELVAERTIAAGGAPPLVVRLDSSPIVRDAAASWKALIARREGGNYPLGVFSAGDEPETPVSELLDTLASYLSGQAAATPLRRELEVGAEQPGHLIMVVDKLYELADFYPFVTHPLFGQPYASFLFLVARELYNQWPARTRRSLQQRWRLQMWNVPSLWEPETGLVQSTMELLFGRVSFDDPLMRSNFELFQKHIAFKARGQIGATLYELRRIEYWQIDPKNGQPHIAFDRLDEELIRHHAWVHDLLETNMRRIIGASFSGRERRDRARHGVYALMDWIIEAATFNLDELVAEAESRAVISDYKRQREEVIVRLLDVLVENNYLHKAESAFDVVWGRDISQESFSRATRLFARSRDATVIAGPGLPAWIRAELADVLRRSGYFSSDERLKTVFIDPRLLPWRNTLPQSSNVAERIESTVDFLYERRNDHGMNALVLLLGVLGDMTEAGDSLRQELRSVTQKVENAFASGES